MEEKRLFLLEFYELMKNCVEFNFSENPRMNSEEAMIECTGSHWKIMIEEYKVTMKRVSRLYEEMLLGKFKLIGEGYDKEIEEFCINLRDFINKEFDVKESIMLSVTGSKLIVNEKLYQDLVNASTDELDELEQYRKELVRGRNVIIESIKEMLDEREEQLAELLEEEARQAQEEADKKAKEAEQDALREKMEGQLQDDEDERGKKGQFESEVDSSETEEGSTEKEASDEDGSGESGSGKEHGDNFTKDKNKSESSSNSDSMDYENMSSEQKLFDEFSDEDEDKQHLSDSHQDMIDQEWAKLKKEGKLEDNDMA
jgi:hypothetical protein